MLIILSGIPCSGKSTFAQKFFRGKVLSSDHIRGLVGEGEADQAATGDAFAVLQQMLFFRLKRGLTTVVDATNLQKEHIERYVALAEKFNVPHTLVFFDIRREDALGRMSRRAESGGVVVPLS